MFVRFRESFFWRVLLIVLCITLTGNGWSALAEDESETEIQRRFGLDSIVTMDENGEPVLVNGYPFRPATVTYFDNGQAQAYRFSIDFMDYPFWNASTGYDGNLAFMSLGMALSSSRAVYDESLPREERDPAKNLELFLTDAGFEEIRKDDYSKDTSMYTVSTGIACRRMEAEGQEPFTLVAVGICGGNYKNEWQSNMTPGNGDVHEGFRAASQLVVDRLAGYLATHGIQGKVKVWITGFSRAAAVANLTAATLSDTGMFARKDIYAYTFATPAAVRNPPTYGYEHIHNIICPTDLVPQVMPADWGYGRYGTDFYLAVQEFSSFLGQVVSSMRAETDRNLYAIENNYSPQLNFRMLLLISLVLDVAQSCSYYNDTLQPALVGIMQNKTVPNMLITLRSLMLKLRGSDQNQRINTDELMDYFIRVFSGSVTRSGLGAVDRNTANALYRLFNEHNENSYLANADAIRMANFEPSQEAYYVMIRGPVTVSVAFEHDPDNILSGMKASGERTAEGIENEENGQDYYYMERSGNTTILAVPTDFDYVVTWEAEKSGTVECLAARLSVHASADYSGYQSDVLRVQAGDKGVAFRQKQGRFDLENYTEKIFSGRDLAEFAGIASLGINWRYALMTVCALAGLLVCAILCAISSRKPSRRKRYNFACWFALCLFGIGVLEAEASFWFFADRPLFRILWKALVAACLLFVFFCVHPPKNRLRKSLFPALLLALAADIVLSFHTAAGIVLLMLSHLGFIVYFLYSTRLSRGRWIQWAVVALPLSALIMIFFAPSHGSAGWIAAAYAPILLLMSFSSASQPIRIRVSATFFVLSDLLQGLFFTLLNDPIIHIAGMFFFYIALLLLAISEEDGLNTVRTEGN